MLEIRAATVTYGGTPAVSGVDLEVPDGTVLGLLGPSGCGKSTLLRAIAGLEPLAAGQICWDGADLAHVPVHRRGFGLMFQDGVLFPHRDVAGNIGYGLRTMKYADGTTREFYQIGLSANSTGISVYILGLEDKKYLADRYGKTLGKASVTGYCIRFKSLKDIDLDVLGSAIQFGLENRKEKAF